MINSSTDDFRPTANWSNLRLRADMLRRLREFFDSRGFLEVETPILSADTVVDRHLDPFSTEIDGIGRLAAAGTAACGCAGTDVPSAAKRLWLQTSPEFHMKRLLAAGAGAIYQVARVFRRDELGPLHNPEFTLVEWYQPGDGMDEGMQLTGELCEAMLERGPAERMSYREAFERYVGLDPHTADVAALAAAVEKCGVQPPATLAREDRDGWLDLLMVERVQPRLGFERPVLLFDYPASQAALARVRPGNPPVAERFELFVVGVELANGYHELLDPDELRMRNSRTNAQRIADGKPSLPEENRLLAAMRSGLPSSVGVALGFDRLVMLAAGAKTIAEVMAFPFDLA